MRLASKVDVDILRGTLEGVPELVCMLHHSRRECDFPVQS
jgi:hypothetical protein